MEKWPNFFIVGAPRSGTTFLYHCLKQVSGVYMSPVKEPSYFATSINPDRKLTKPIRDKKKYLKLFEGVKNEIAIGEASPSYLWDPKAAQLIHESVPHAKIIMILRDPVERAFSHYLLGLGIGYETLPFKEAMKKALNGPNDYTNRIAACSFYSEEVNRYLKTFKKEKIKIFIFEEFMKDERKSLEEVLDFLGVHTEIPESLNIVSNTVDVSIGRFSQYLIRNRVLRSIVRDLLPEEGGVILRKIFSKETKKPTLSIEDRKFVEGIYQEDVIKLQKILERKLPWPLAKKFLE